MLATTRIHKLVNHDGSCENISKNNFTLSIAVGSSDMTAQASTNTGKLRMWYADIRGQHGKKWNYESGDHYMGRKK